MKKLTALGFALLIACGCASMLPPIQDQHPDGYNKLVELVPECRKESLKACTACLAAANILESSFSEQATTRFLAHWEETAFGMAARKQHAGESFSVLDPGGGVLHETVWGSVK